MCCELKKGEINKQDFNCFNILKIILRLHTGCMLMNRYVYHKLFNPFLHSTVVSLEGLLTSSYANSDLKKIIDV